MQGVISGAVASSISTLILYPWQKIKINMQVDANNNSILETIKKINQKQGLEGFYKGLKPLVIGNSLSYAVYFYFYEKIKLIFPDKSVKSSIICSACAGISSTFFLNPFWVLQTKSALSEKTQGFIQISKQLIKKQGWKAFWKGLSSSLVLVLNPIIQFVTYQWLKLKIDSKSKFLDLIIFIIAAFSKALATLFTYPLTVLRTYQHLDVQKKGVLFIIHQIVGKYGLKALFKGLTPKMIQTVLNSAFLLMIYQRLSKLVLWLINQIVKK